MEIYQRRQVKKSKCLECLRIYNAAVGQRLTAELQFLHHPNNLIVKSKASYDHKSKFCRLKRLPWQTIFRFSSFFESIKLVRETLSDLIC